MIDKTGALSSRHEVGAVPRGVPADDQRALRIDGTGAQTGGLASLPLPRRRLTLGPLDIALYDSGHPKTASSLPPLIVVHSVNAAASAFEMEPVVARQSALRRVVALDLPGFAASARPDIEYSPSLMCEALVAVIDYVQAPQIDLIALSLACEFAAEAALLRPRRVRSLALISPTGMEWRRLDETHTGRTREVRALRWLLRDTPLGRWLFKLLTKRASINMFLARAWGTRDYDRRLLAQALYCASRPGAAHAPLDFVSGALFSVGILQRYRQLPMPLWVGHGTRGSFTDFGACPQHTSAARIPVQRQAFEAGAMPHFERADEFDTAYRAFLDALR